MVFLSMRFKSYLKIINIFVFLFMLKYLVFYKPVPTSNSNITVLVIVENEEHLKLYTLAQESVECYCKIYNYNFVRIVLENSPEHSTNCIQKDFMFRRHCTIVNFLNENPTVEYLLFIDADMGVINPHHRIEEYIDSKYDMLFYERIYDYEIVAGSFLIKNTHFAKQFLETWSNFEPLLPKSFHGSDNAALHQIFLNYFDPTNKKMHICKKIWNNSKDWEGVFDYIACARSLLNERLIFDRIKILSKSSKSRWARDGWLTDTKWSSNDFILHGWKSIFLDQPGFAMWTNPFVPHVKFRLSQCDSYTNPFKDWKYKLQFKKNDEDINRILQNISTRVRNEYNVRLKRIWDN